MVGVYDKAKKGFTVGCYLGACFIDFVSSMALQNLGYAEHNVLYSLLGSVGFWILYWIVSCSLLILLFTVSEKWWWSYLILWLPTVAHTICGVHNITLFLYCS